VCRAEPGYAAWAPLVTSLTYTAKFAAPERRWYSCSTVTRALQTFLKHCPNLTHLTLPELPGDVLARVLKAYAAPNALRTLSFTTRADELWHVDPEPADESVWRWFPHLRTLDVTLTGRCERLARCSWHIASLQSLTIRADDNDDLRPAFYPTLRMKMDAAATAALGRGGSSWMPDAPTAKIVQANDPARCDLGLYVFLLRSCFPALTALELAVPDRTHVLLRGIGVPALTLLYPSSTKGAAARRYKTLRVWPVEDILADIVRNATGNLAPRDVAAAVTASDGLALAWTPGRHSLWTLHHCRGCPPDSSCASKLGVVDLCDTLADLHAHLWGHMPRKVRLAAQAAYAHVLAGVRTQQGKRRRDDDDEVVEDITVKRRKAAASSSKRPHEHDADEDAARKRVKLNHVASAQLPTPPADSGNKSTQTAVKETASPAAGLETRGTKRGRSDDSDVSLEAGTSKKARRAAPVQQGR
jgi:hypothetical protein